MSEPESTPQPSSPEPNPTFPLETSSEEAVPAPSNGRAAAGPPTEHVPPGSGDPTHNLKPPEGAAATELGTIAYPPPEPVDRTQGISYDPEAPTVLPPEEQGEGEVGDGPTVPGYQILGTLGRGGMGVVYKARQPRLGRFVALKMVLAGAHASKQQLARFRAEAELIGKLQHPNIVQVYEGDEHDGCPYFSMEYVEGNSLAHQINRGPLSATQAAELVETLARAMHFAHQFGIVHRDLKPANILLRRDGTPKITDFGIAKDLEQEDGPTQTGSVLGTPNYMAPEQAAGHTKEVGPAADVYALGAILYECLTGRPPFLGATPLDTMQQVRTLEPVPPGRLLPRLPRDLDTICMKCLRKEAYKRYDTAEELADDLRRFLRHEPVKARPVGRAERVWRWCRRNPVVAALTAAVVLALVGGTVVSTYFAIEASLAAAEARTNEAEAVEERQRADAKAKEAQENLQEAVAQKERADRNAEVAGKNAEEARKNADKADRNAAEARKNATEAKASETKAKDEMERSLRSSYVAHLNLAQRAWEEASVPRVRELLAQLAPRSPAGLELRGFEWRYLWRLCHPAALDVKGRTSAVTCVAYSPDGKLLATSGDLWYGEKWEYAPGQVKVWDAVTGHEVLTFKGHTGPVFGVAFSPDGKRVASAAGVPGEKKGETTGQVKVWEAVTGKEILTLGGHSLPVKAVAFSPDGRLLATASWDGTVKLWDAATGKETRTLRGHTGYVLGVAFNWDGKFLASVSGTWDAQKNQYAHGEVKLWATATGEEHATLEGRVGGVDVAFSPNGTRLAVAHHDHLLRMWDVMSQQPQFVLKGHAGPVNALAYSPDGTRLASAGHDRTVKVWDTATGQERFTLRGHNLAVWSVAYGPGGKRLASAGGNPSWPDVPGEIRVWDAATDPEVRVLTGHQLEVSAVSFSPDGKFLASAAGDRARTNAPGELKVWDAAGRPLLTLTGHKGYVTSVAYSPDGKALASGSTDKTVKLWDAAAGRETRTLTGHAGSVLSVAFSADARYVASASQDKTIRLWDVATTGEPRVLAGHEDSVFSVAFSRDGELLASAGRDRTVRLWDVRSGKELRVLRDHADQVTAVAFRPDGKRLASASFDRTVRIWDLEGDREPQVLKGHTWGVSGLAFSPDGGRLASASSDKMVKLWDLATGQEVLTLPGHVCVAFSPDGLWLAAGGGDNTVKLWDGRPLTDSPAPAVDGPAPKR